MKTISTYLILATFTFLFFACKSDPKVNGGEMTSSENNQTKKLEEAMKVDPDHIEAARKTGIYTKEERLKDSIQFAKKLLAINGSNDVSQVSALLDAEAVKRANTGAKTVRTGLLQPCNAISVAEVGKLVGLPESSIKRTVGNKGRVESDKSTSCFWRWGNEGVVIQISENPLPDEVSDWSTRYMNTKKSSGERSLSDPSSVAKFKDFDGPGKMNIYSRESGRFYASQGEELVVALIFNGNMEASKQMNVATTMLNKIFENL